MNQELKQKVYQLLIDKIDVDSFQEYLFGLVEITELKSDSLLFELVDINYKREEYKKELSNLIKGYFTEDELMSLEIYERCLSLIEIEEEKMFIELDELSSLYIRRDFSSELLSNFYMLNVEIDNLEIGYNLLDKEQIIKNTREYARLVIENFKTYKEKKDWNNFMNDTVFMNFNYMKGDNENIVPTKIENRSFIRKEPQSNSNKVFDFIKGILGLR